MEKLLICNEHYRLGAQDIHEILQHPWFADVDWQAMRAREVEPPWRPCHGEASVQFLREKKVPKLSLRPSIRRTMSSRALT